MTLCLIMLSLKYDETPDSTDHPYTRKGQTVYLVFELALLLLFSSCSHCSSYTSAKKVVTGSFLWIIQTCSICSWKYPHICHSVALPSKAQLMFQSLNLATITSTFFCHQCQYLQPAINFVWNRCQEQLLRSLKQKGIH